MNPLASLAATGLAPGPSASARSSQPAAPEAAFSQLLQRELQARPVAPSPQAARPAQPQASTAKQPPAGKTESPDSPSPSCASSATATAAAGKAEVSQDGDARQERSTQEDDPVAGPADPSALLLALVGGREHRTAAAAGKQDDQGGEAEPPALRGSGRLTNDNTLLEAAELTGRQDAEAGDLPDLPGGGLLSARGAAPTLEGAASPFAAALGAQQQTQIGGLDSASPSAAGAGHVTARLGTPQWDQAIGQRMLWMAAGAQQSASLTLNPPELGPLQVVLSLNNTQASATFISAQPDVRQALEAALPRLREMLGDAGIQLGQASVNAGNPGQQGSAQPGFGSDARHHANGGESDASGEAMLAAAEPVVRTTRGRGMVDTFA